MKEIINTFQVWNTNYSLLSALLLDVNVVHESNLNYLCDIIYSYPFIKSLYDYEITKYEWIKKK